MSRGKLADCGINAIRRRNVLTLEIEGHGIEIDIVRHCRKPQQRLDFGTKDERSGVPRVVQGFYAEVIAREEQLGTPAIPYSECEHARDPLEQLATPLTPTVNQHFTIAVGGENMAGIRELAPQRSIVIDLAVENDRDILIRRDQGLVAAFDVDDRESAMTEAHCAVAIITVGIGPPVHQSLGHARQGFPCPPVGAYIARDAAHDGIGRGRPCPVP